MFQDSVDSAVKEVFDKLTSEKGIRLSAEFEVLYMVNVSKEGQVYECEICGNVVVVKVVGGGELVCCGQPMNLTKE